MLNLGAIYARSTADLLHNHESTSAAMCSGLGSRMDMVLNSYPDPTLANFKHAQFSSFVVSQTVKLKFAVVKWIVVPTVAIAFPRTKKVLPQNLPRKMVIAFSFSTGGKK